MHDSVTVNDFEFKTFLNEVRGSRGQILDKRMAGLMCNYINWGKSPQGHEYWSLIYKTVVRIPERVSSFGYNPDENIVYFYITGDFIMQLELLYYKDNYKEAKKITGMCKFLTSKGV